MIDDRNRQNLWEILNRSYEIKHTSILIAKEVKKCAAGEGAKNSYLPKNKAQALVCLL